MVAAFLWPSAIFFGHHDFPPQDRQRNLVKNWFFRSKVASALMLFCNRRWQKYGAITCSNWGVQLFDFVRGHSVCVPHEHFCACLRRNRARAEVDSLLLVLCLFWILFCFKKMSPFLQVVDRLFRLIHASRNFVANACCKNPNISGKLDCRPQRHCQSFVLFTCFVGEGVVFV